MAHCKRHGHDTGKNAVFSVTWIGSSKLGQSWATILQNPTTMTAAITIVSVMERLARAFIGVFLAAAIARGGVCQSRRRKWYPHDA
jgi:hypothetical protein